MRKYSSGSSIAAISIGLTVIAAGIAGFAGWLTHVIVCLMRIFSNDPSVDATTTVIVLVLGAIFAPVGAIHGVLIWFGVA